MSNWFSWKEIVGRMRSAHPATRRHTGCGAGAPYPAYLLVASLLLLPACERQADRVFDRNPEYAGKADVHEHYPDAETLRKRALMGQTDR